jgi:hypothetical protein
MRLARGKHAAIDFPDASALLGRSLFDVILLLEAINTALSIDELVFPGKEGVAVRADFNGERPASRPGLNHVPAGAADSGGGIHRVKILLHEDFL